MEIEKHLIKNCGELIKDDGIYKATIADVELDALELCFNGANDVTINTENYSDITLDLKSLRQLKQLILKAEDLYSNELS